MRASRLKARAMKQSMGIDPGAVTLSWLPEGGVSQRAYQIVMKCGAKTIYDSGAVSSNKTVHTPDVAIPPRTRVEWFVTLWDEKDCAGETTSDFFETGIAQDEWRAKWINPELTPPPHYQSAVGDTPLNVASYLVKRYVMPAHDRARLYITAHGCYDVWLNGSHVDGYFLAPGVNQYDKHLQVQTYDVAALLHERGKRNGRIPGRRRLARQYGLGDGSQLLRP